jgi:hypothetical protein
VAFVATATPARAADPTTSECLSASEKSLSLANEHKLRAARAALLVCASASCPKDIQKECARRVDETNSAIPTIVFGAKDGQGNDLSAVRVTMDGETISERLDGTAIALDPGAHDFTFQAPGQPVLKKQIVARQGEKERREMLQFGKPPALAPVVAGPPPVPPPDAPRPLGAQRIAALAVGSLGLAGIGVGAAFGGLSLSKQSQAKSVCPGAGCPTQQGVDLWNTTRTDGTIATVSLAVGGAALATGVILWFTARPRAPKSGGLSVGPGSVSFTEVW